MVHILFLSKADDERDVIKCNLCIDGDHVVEVEDDAVDGLRGFGEGLVSDLKDASPSNSLHIAGLVVGEEHPVAADLLLLFKLAQALRLEGIIAESFTLLLADRLPVAWV